MASIKASRPQKPTREILRAFDPETGKTVLYPTPTPNSGPHRIEMAAGDQLWFAEIGAKKIGFFDTKTKQFKEWAALGDDDPAIRETLQMVFDLEGFRTAAAADGRGALELVARGTIRPDRMISSCNRTG